MRALLIGLGKHGVEGAQLEPFSMYRRSLRRELGLSFRRTDVASLAEIEPAFDRCPSDIAFVMTSWRESVEETIALFRRLHARSSRPRIVYLDSTDPTSTPFFGILPWVDLYVKKQLLRNLGDYQREFRGGHIFADHMATRHGFDLNGWHFGSKIPDGHASRVKTGWNLGVTKRLRHLLRHHGSRPVRRKIHDVFCRLSLGLEETKDWYQQHRADAVESLAPLSGDYQVLATGFLSGGRGFVDQRQYYREMRRSRIVFSPFGWGEVCWRDYEAVCFDCLLVKPSMDHLTTEPDIFRPEETYVPVRWDLSDVAEKCRYYLDHPDESRRIIAAARRAYEDYFERRRFVDSVREILDGL
jgi:hypothetical protein